MVKLFKKILIPVDFSEGSGIAIEKAVQLAESDEAVICLLYICKPLFSLNIFANNGYIIAPAADVLTISEIERKIQHYKTFINEKLKGVIVETIVSEGGKLQRKIEETAEIFRPDLILLYKKGGRSRLNLFNGVCPDNLAKLTNCPVLTIKDGSGKKKIQNIVLPVCQRYPGRKLEIAIRLARTFNAIIHLISFPECKNEDEKSDDAFIESFKRIRENASLIIKHGPVFGSNVARAVLRYAESVQADMVLVNPLTESCIRQIIGSVHMSDLLPERSPIQILDVEPYSLAN